MNSSNWRCRAWSCRVFFCQRKMEGKDYPSERNSILYIYIHNRLKLSASTGSWWDTYLIWIDLVGNYTGIWWDTIFKVLKGRHDSLFFEVFSGHWNADLATSRGWSSVSVCSSLAPKTEWLGTAGVLAWKVVLPYGIRGLYAVHDKAFKIRCFNRFEDCFQSR